MEYHQAQRRYLIKLESGLIIRRNRIPLRKRLTSCATEHHNRSFSGTGPGDEEDGPRRTRQAFDQGHDEQANASPRRSRRMYSGVHSLAKNTARWSVTSVRSKIFMYCALHYIFQIINID